MVTVAFVLIVAAVVVEFLAAVNVPSRVNLIPLGLAFWASAVALLLVPRLG